MGHILTIVVNQSIYIVMGQECRYLIQMWHTGTCGNQGFELYWSYHWWEGEIAGASQKLWRVVENHQEHGNILNIQSTTPDFQVNFISTYLNAICTHTHVYILIHRYIAQYIYIIHKFSQYHHTINWLCTCMYMQFWHILKSHEEAARDDRMPQLLGVFPMGITHQQKCSETDEWWRFSIGTDKDKT